MWESLHTLRARLDPPEPPLMTLTLAMFADPVRTGVAALPDLEAELALIDDHLDTERVLNVAGAAFYADRLGRAREPLWRRILEGRAGGPARRRIVLLMDVCVDDFHRGHWQEAAELAAEGLAVCQEAGRFFSWYFLYHQALLAAVRGRFEAGRELAAEIIGWAGPRGVGTAQTYARHALVLAESGAGEWEAAYRHAAAVSPPGTLASHVPHALWVALDLVDAALRTGRRDEAARHVRVLLDSGVAELSPRMAIQVAAAQALVADDAAAPALFERALGLPTVDEWPFDTARIRLAYGERLRRARAAAEARVPLEQALTAFRKLGAEPWARRAERELRAAGQAVHTVVARGPLAALTPQELQIASLAAAGLTNKQIGERLYLSSRTVSGHLYRIFPKLGITTRAALRDALGVDADQD